MLVQNPRRCLSRSSRVEQIKMANVHPRQLTVWLIVLCSIVAQANGLRGSTRVRSSSRRGSFRVSYTAGETYDSTSSSGSLSTEQIIGLVFGLIGGIIALIVILILVMYCWLKRRASTEETGQTIKYSCKNSVIRLPPSYADAVSDHPANWRVTRLQPNPLKFLPSEPTVYGNPGDSRYAAEGTNCCTHLLKQSPRLLTMAERKQSTRASCTTRF